MPKYKSEENPNVVDQIIRLEGKREYNKILEIFLNEVSSYEMRIAALDALIKAERKEELLSIFLRPEDDKIILVIDRLLQPGSDRSELVLFLFQQDSVALKIKENFITKLVELRVFVSLELISKNQLVSGEIKEIAIGKLREFYINKINTLQQQSNYENIYRICIRRNLDEHIINYSLDVLISNNQLQYVHFVVKSFVNPMFVVDRLVALGRFDYLQDIAMSDDVGSEIKKEALHHLICTSIGSLNIQEDDKPISTLVESSHNVASANSVAATTEVALPHQGFQNTEVVSDDDNESCTKSANGATDLEVPQNSSNDGGGAHGSNSSVSPFIPQLPRILDLSPINTTGIESDMSKNNECDEYNKSIADVACFVENGYESANATISKEPSPISDDIYTGNSSFVGMTAFETVSFNAADLMGNVMGIIA